MDLESFVKESNRIEGIKTTTRWEIKAHKMLLELPKLLIEDVRHFVSIIQPNAKLRDIYGRDVRVGAHVPPAGGPAIRQNLDNILDVVSTYQGFKEMAYMLHKQYEALHPFTDGNGRSGRAIWLWMMNGEAPLGFLHHWYYQSLEFGR